MAQMTCHEEEDLVACLVNPETRQLASSIEHRQVFYAYPQAREIFQSFLYPPFLRADCSANHRGLIYFLYGDYHTGKSHLLRYFTHLMKRVHPEFWERHEAPIVQVDLTNHVNTAQQLLQFLLEKLGRPIDHRLINNWKKTNSVNTQLQGRLIALLEQLGTRVLILDECQKLLVSRNPDVTDIFEFLKDLSTKHNWTGDLRTQVILCGTKDGVPLLEAADWIQGRTRTVKLHALQVEDFASLLLKIYRDFTGTGVSSEWPLVKWSQGGKKRKLNEELAHYLFSRTAGKVGLTVDLIRNAVLLALDQGRLFPTGKDYEAIRLTEKSFVFTDTPLIPVIKRDSRVKGKVRVTLHDRTCSVRSCVRFDKPYAKYRSLVQHYKLKHPDLELVYDGD